MPFDYKKEYKEFYMPKNRPSIVEIPGMNYIAIRGQGDPNEENGYQLDINDKRLHHEIYLSDARKVAPEKIRTVIRHPIKRNRIRYIWGRKLKVF
mgnify:CR=1 FL=1